MSFQRLSLLVLSLVFASPAFAVLVGKVDIQKVLITVDQGQKVRDKLKKIYEDKKKVIDTEQNKIKKMKEDFDKQSLVMNEKAKQEKERKIQEQIVELQQKSLAYQKEMQDMENNLKMPILENIRVAIDEVSKGAGVDMTFESSTAPVVYAKSEKDLTDDVIKLYNKKFPSK
jgi:outer membrane protein